MWDSKKSIFTLSELREVLSNDSQWESSKESIKSEYQTTVTAGSRFAQIFSVGSSIITEVNYNGDINYKPLIKPVVGYYYCVGQFRQSIGRMNPSIFQPFNAGSYNPFDTSQSITNVEGVRSYVDKIDFSTDNITRLTNGCIKRIHAEGYVSDLCGYATGGGSGDYGWEDALHSGSLTWGPGTTGSRPSITPKIVSFTEKLTFADETIALSPSSNFPLNIKGQCTTSDSDKGYLIGGTLAIPSLGGYNQYMNVYSNVHTINFVTDLISYQSSHSNRVFGIVGNAGTRFYIMGGLTSSTYKEERSSGSGLPGYNLNLSGKYDASNNPVSKYISSTSSSSPVFTIPSGGYYQSKIDSPNALYVNYGGLKTLDKNFSTFLLPLWYTPFDYKLKASSEMAKLIYSTETLTPIPAGSHDKGYSLGSSSKGYVHNITTAQSSSSPAGYNGPTGYVNTFTVATESFAPITTNPNYFTSSTAVCNIMNNMPTTFQLSSKRLSIPVEV